MSKAIWLHSALKSLLNVTENIAIVSFSFTDKMAYALYRGTRLGLALQEALGEMEEYEQISPNVRNSVLRKFDEVQDDNIGIIWQ